MNRQDILIKIQEIFREVFDDAGIKISETTEPKQIEQWDSLGQVTLMVGMEEAFNIKFTISEFIKLKNVGEMIDIISAKISNSK